MAEYNKMKNAELEALLKERGLPHTGKKADLIKRLQESDTQKTEPSATKNDEEIDWDDEPAAPADASKATTDAAAAAVAAGGKGQPPNPQAVPNQVADIDPSKTDDLTVSKPDQDASEAHSTEPEPADATQEAAPSDAQTQVQETKPAVDFSSGLATTTLDEEIAKRKARAKKFGLDENEDEALKALERAKRFGNTDLPGKLNEALPERRERNERKRPAPAADDQGARKKRPGPAGRSNSRRNTPRAAEPKKEKPAAASGMSDADRAKAEARKARFA